ncbi:hypothetical protein K491DRAFT_695861 [Lophiostoma macrostomum CBS 122681]|uniref:FUN14-domain-containing protein n=1 Tax=Lophiostoma macrostomum CBS 122681 TaxID=1314788 RepID=A0A6A6SYL6_9PLEO|nr:hypothetical protein K491DRAFT_695861 [Lophiostoma macrostomum CBS 122681]
MSFPPSSTLLRARVLPPLILSTPFLLHQHFYPSRPIQCDSPDPLTKITSDLKSSFSRRDAPAPATVQQSGVGLNPKTVRQISLGSVLGLLGGLGVSVFSKPLAILFGLGVVIVQLLETRGIHIVPYSYLQRRFSQTNISSLVQSNPAFKFTFGTTFALAAFAEF